MLKRLEYSRPRRKSSLPHRRRPGPTKAPGPLADKIQGKVREVRTALEKNMRLLSFSMDHVKSSLEKVVELIDRTSYEKGRSISVMVSRQV